MPIDHLSPIPPPLLISGNISDKRCNLENVETIASGGNILVSIAIFSCEIKVSREKAKIPFPKPFNMKPFYLHLSDLVIFMLMTS